MTGKDHDSLYEALSECFLELRVSSRVELRLEASADFRFPAGFTGFHGHFPGNPILPAIVQLVAVRFLAERSLGQPLAPTQHHKIKFKEAIRPGDPVTVNIVLKNDGAMWGGTFSLKRPDGAAVAVGSVEFTP